MDGWLIFFVLLTAYVAFVYWVRSRQKGLGMGFELNGPFLMWRTQFGKKTIEKVARPRAFWNVVADGGIVLTWAIGALIFLFLAYLFYEQLKAFFFRPALVAQNATSPEFLLGIPGVNPLIPVGYGAIAIILALVIHEGSHGVMAYASKMRVKSLGLLFFIVPVGAFVEPDEEDLERSTTREKNRVFAAGPTSNIVLATVAGIILSTMFLGAMVPDTSQPALITSVEGGSGAGSAGLLPGDRIVMVEGKPTRDRAEFTSALEGKYAGQQLGIDYVRDGEQRHAEAILGDRATYFRSLGINENTTGLRDEEGNPITGAEFLARETGKGFLGLSVMGAADLDATVKDRLQHPFASPANFLFYNIYPLVIFSTNVDVLAAPYNDYFMVEGAMASIPAPVFFALASILYWIVWINVTLATFNALPMGPLDGGQMFRVTLRERLMKKYRVDHSQVHYERAEMGGMRVVGRDPDTQAKLDKIQGLVKRTTYTLGFSILGLILIPILVPWVLRVFY